MTTEMIEFLKDLADVIEKHNGGLTYTNNDDGIHVMVKDDWNSKICIEWPSNGNVSRIRKIIANNTL